jgi:hypothetical protein
MLKEKSNINFCLEFRRQIFQKKKKKSLEGNIVWLDWQSYISIIT